MIEARADRTYLSVRRYDGREVDLAEHGPESREVRFLSYRERGTAKGVAELEQAVARIFNGCPIEVPEERGPHIGGGQRVTASSSSPDRTM